jgi:hypothetical protein
MRKLYKCCGLMFFCALLSACVAASNFGNYWQKSLMDPCLMRIGEAVHFAQFNRTLQEKEITTLVRGLKLQNHYFMLLKERAGDVGGNLYRFEVTNGIFQRYRLNPAMRKVFAHDYPQAPVHFRFDTARLDLRDKNAVALLLEIAAKPDYWQVESKAMYNPTLDAACPFEDRDLRTIER